MSSYFWSIHIYLIMSVHHLLINLKLCLFRAGFLAVVVNILHRGNSFCWAVYLWWEVMTWIVQGFPHPSSAICPDRQALNLSQAPTVERDWAPTYQTTKANKNGQTLVLLYCQRQTASPLYTLNWKRCPLNLFSNDVYVYFHIYMVVKTLYKKSVSIRI